MLRLDASPLVADCISEEQAVKIDRQMNTVNIFAEYAFKI